MELIQHGLSTLLVWVLPFLFVLSVVVFFHELGHFLVARWNGVGVSKFAVGFGPDIWGFTDKHGTRWALSVIPLGGYVKFIDDRDPSGASPSNADELERAGVDPSKLFAKKKLWQRASVVAAGPIANFILAVVIFAGIFLVNGRDILSAKVDEVLPNSVAASAGFEVGDTIMEIDGTKIESFTDLQRIVSVSADIPLAIKVLRNGNEVMLNATPAFREVDDRFGGIQRIGQLGIQRSSSPDAIIHKSFGPIGALNEGVSETGYVMKRTVTFFIGLFTGRESVDQLGGPIRIAEVSKQVAAISFIALMSLTAVLSVSIGIMNLLPIPVLDGGHLVFYAIEAVKGSPLSEKAQEYCFKFGLAVVLSMMVFVTTIDISRLFG